nr:MAG TPA: tail assembly chaperone protein [Caudoviricetes sp.]
MSNGLKKKTVTIEKGRDKGKTFLITEMPAIQADEWAHELFYHAATAGMDLKNVNVMNLDTKSMAGMIEIGAAIGSILGRIKPEESRRLKFELLDKCVQIVPKGGQERMCIWDQEIQDMQNFTFLAAQVIGLHLDFLKQGETSN